MGKQWKWCQNLFSWGSKSLQMVTAAMKLKDLLLRRKAMTNLDSLLKRKDFANKGPSSQSYGFSRSHVWIWKWKSLSCVPLFVTRWTVAHQAPPSMGFFRQEYWSGLPFPSPGDLSDPGIEPRSPALQADALTSEPPGKSHFIWENYYRKFK